jgi:hypothetical protein
MSYTVTTFDDSAEGMERLRDQSEFILLAYPSKDSTPDDILQQFVDDIQTCDRFDGFDYDAAREAVIAWYDSDTVARVLGWIDWPESDDDIGDDFYPVFRLYVETEN